MAVRKEYILKNKRTINTTISAMKCFKQCRRRFFFSYIENLKPVSTPKPLSFGRAIHTGIEKLLSGSKIEEAITATLLAFNDENGVIDHLELQYEQSKVKACLEAFNRECDYSNWKVIELEKEFKVSLGYGKYFRGKIDALVDINNKIYILEHKTASQIGEKYLHNLLWDEQASAYLYAMDELGFEISGMFYNIIQKPTPKPALATSQENRKYKKDGSLYANMRDKDERPSEYFIRLQEWYLKESRFTQHFVYRTREQINNAKTQFVSVMKDMRLAEVNDSFYPNPQACNILGCWAESLCLDYTPEMAEHNPNFTKKIQTHEELAEVKK